MGELRWLRISTSYLRQKKITIRIDAIQYCWKHGFTSNVWDEITYPFPNFNGCNIELFGLDK